MGHTITPTDRAGWLVVALAIAVISFFFGAQLYVAYLK